ncbi:tRNA pseudouridine(55) synthase TruB [Candidatus Peregrinibacteria bacterium]|jgi:tRNA pseudouridine55 synthase|nr:tRNA pseudouridine(55) synthase TruB [Candidatus Peregrinibacteria bacterium]MBT7703489.1 tRNA pseudouridine(55) synthase TruB [Candidatus Peregrinibacteria bacterium]
MKGFLIVDKPQGITSFDVVAQARRALNVRKIGHLGTLDPLATGVLVLAIGEGTKLIEYLMGADKEYEATLEFGKISDTYDSEGKITKTDAPVPTSDEIEAALPQFRGEIQQIPPAFSALKINGQRAYDLARRGEKVELKPRTVYIHDLTLVAPDQLHIHCSSGTYIRSIIHDLGQTLGCGAIMTALRRTHVGQFMLNKAIDITKTSPENLISLEEIVSSWPPVKVNKDEMIALQQGQKVHIGTSSSGAPLQPPHTDTIFAVFYNDTLVSLAELNSGFLTPVKNFMVK